MTLRYVEILPAGNAVRLYFLPPEEAASITLLRRTSGVFTGPDDPAALVVADLAEIPEPCVLSDTLDLANGTNYIYRAYYNGDQDLYDDASATPQASYQDVGVDVVSLLLERLRLGLAVEVDRGTLRPKTGSIAVQNATPLWDETAFPVVTVQLTQAAPDTRALGEVIDAGVELSTAYLDGEGMLDRVRVALVGWSLNPDERIALRRAVRRILNANLPVFEDAGILAPEWSQRDQDEMQAYNIPVYQTLTEFSCLVVEGVESETANVTAVESFLTQAM